MSKQPPKMKTELRTRGKKRERTPSPEESLSSPGDETPRQFAVPQISISPRLRDQTSQLHTSSQVTATDASVTASPVATPLVTSPTSQSSHDQSPSARSHHASPSLKAAKATAKKPRAPRQDFVLSEEEEKVMFEWLEATEEVWNAKKAGYHKHDVKQGLWEAQAKVMNKSAEHLIGWFKSVRDTNTRLVKKGKGKSGDGDNDDEIWTDRQRFIMASMKFMDKVVRHRPKAVRSVEAVIREHAGNLNAAEAAAAAQEAVDVDSEGRRRSSTSARPRRRSIKKGKMDRMLQLMQERAEESRARMEELRKCKEQHPSTARNAFAAYVRDSLNTMSEWSYRKAKDEIYRVLTKYEDGAEEERVKQQQQQQQFQQQRPHHHVRPQHTVLPVQGLQPVLSCLSANMPEVQQLRDMLKLQLTPADEGMITDQEEEISHLKEENKKGKGLDAGFNPPNLFYRTRLFTQLCLCY
ncbi:uncharacterized protein LOC117530300 [Thalassophryne amazonica]|uniref:uncharacterized protein LOC117530300 n=1 Tax=Thalassophryne amazonica TaxID=390379 RepID=UPI001470BD7B|nr:uncharacterized protein LOC117530300 [Thalassophryne amazonica]